MASEWPACKLDELGFVGRGKSKHRPRDEPSLYGGKYPFFQTGDIKAANYHLTEYSQTYSQKGLAQSKLWQPGTLCITIAANIAETAILGVPGCFPDSVVGFVADPQKADVRFVKYFIDTIKLQMQSVSRGTTQDNLSVDKLLTFNFRVPCLSVQRRIANILSAYDELIVNNQQRIRMLDSMVRAFFVSAIPKSSKVKKLGDIAENVRRNVQKGQLDDPKPYVGLEHIPRRSLALDSWEMESDLGSNKLEFKKGEILFGKIRPYFHKVSIAPFEGLCSADTIVIRAREPEYFPFVAACVSSDTFVAHASATANGAKMPRANWDVLKKYNVPIPKGENAKRFSALFAAIVAQQQALIFQIKNLRQTRDLLMPRLLSGQLEINVT